MDLKGQTGSRFYPISKQEYKERTSIKSLTEQLKGCFSLDDLLQHHDTKSYRVLAKRIKDAGEADEFAFDTSYSSLWDYLREECELNDKDAFIFECTGGGRCFDKDFKGNKNERLSKWIRKFEN